MKNDNSPRLDPLTSLRFFAAAMIVAYHGGGRGIGPTWPLDFALGQGVSFFFVLSGFVLSYNYPVLTDKAAIMRFYLARLARIWPLHIATAAVYIIFIGNISYYSLPESSRGLISISYLTLTQAWVPISAFVTSYNTVSWSISTEFFFYLCFPALIYHWNSTWRTKLLSTFVMAVIMWILATKFAIASNGTEDGRGNLGYINPLARIFEFTLGISIQYIYKKRQLKHSQSLNKLQYTAIESLILFISIFSLWSSHSLSTQAGLSNIITKTGSMLLATSGYGTLVFSLVIYVFAIGRGYWSTVLKLRPLVFLGEISFALYLIHTLFLLYRQQAPGVFESFSPAEIYILYWATGLSLAVLLHLSIELPCQQFFRQAVQRLDFSSLPKTLTSVSLGILIFAFLVHFQPSNRTDFSLALSGERQSMLQEPAEFDAGYRIDSIDLRESPDHKQTVRFAWTALKEVSLNYRVAVHLLDEKGKMVGQLDYAMDTGYRNAISGEQWTNSVSTRAIDPHIVKTIGVSVYNIHGMSHIRKSANVQSDWGETRLLVSTEPKWLARNREDHKNAFTIANEISPKDLIGAWKAGTGIAHVEHLRGTEYRFITETGLIGTGTVNEGNIVVPSWNVTGLLSSDRTSIDWNNGFHWKRH